MDIVDVFPFFRVIESEKYCIVKGNGIENLRHGDDIDIFAFDINRLARCIISEAKKYIENENSTIHIEDQRPKSNHVNIDIVKSNKICLRFDLYGELPAYHKVRVKPGLFEWIIEDAREKVVERGGESCVIKIIDKNQDLVIRYLEYVEYFAIRPDKIKHLDYILNKLDSEMEKENFLDILHYYTEFPKAVREINIKRHTIVDNIQYILYKCKGKSIQDLIFIFKQKFF